jgi:Cys-rich protein (TIGR01571 family)
MPGSSCCPKIICCGNRQKDDILEDKFCCFDIYYNIDNNSDVKNKWSQKLFENNDCCQFLLSILCFYFVHFEHYTFAKYNIQDTCICSCFIFELLGDIILCPLCCGTKTNVFLTRQFLKKKYNIESNICTDLLSTFFCPCLVVYQHDNEIKNQIQRNIIQVK